MKTTRLAGAALALLLLAGGTALAKRVTVVPGDQPVTVDIPGSWKVSEIKRGVQAKTADDEVYIWFESYRPAQLQTLIGEHNAYFKEQGVTITGEAKAKQVEFPTYMLKISEYPAIYEKKPTVLRYISVVPKFGDLRHLLVSYWASPEGDKEYDGETNKIINSLAASYDAR
ncbi:MAG: hypothetical protein WAP03_02945 [Methylorubrum rhodinum]|uniref:hypothetical protein n=1 Tax=Methylorubrum rhodinum TaxID=29428 RepID=UPI003BB094F0